MRRPYKMSLGDVVEWEMENRVVRVPPKPGSKVKGDCAIFPGGLKPRIRGAGEYVPLYAAVCTAAHGPRPDGKEVSHLCGRGRRSGDCIVPHHMEWDSRAGNAAWMKLHGTDSRGERHGGSKLTEQNVHWIKTALRAGLFTHRAIADFFGISIQAISDIKTGRGWKHVQPVTHYAAEGAASL